MTTESQESPQTPSTKPTIDQDLLNKVQALKALTATYNLLDRGSYPHNALVAVVESMKFVRSLHEQLLAEALAHPEASEVPELSKFKGQE